MSIAFDKRDYVYNGDDLEYEQVRDEEEYADEENGAALENQDAEKMPNEWVLDLFQDLKDIANFHAVQLLDRCDVLDFAEFLATYSEDVFAKY